jgi:N utilization substance protein B
MAPVLDRPVEELYPIELAILRIAIFELEHHLDVPYRVVINEALELTKTYGAAEGFRYVNAVLDQIAKQHREIEIKAGPKSKAKG